VSSFIGDDRTGRHDRGAVEDAVDLDCHYNRHRFARLRSPR